MKIENNTERGISNGRLEALDLDPPALDNQNKNWLLKDSIAIPSHDHVFVDVAFYDEGSSSAGPGTWMQLIVPSGAFFAESLPRLSLEPHTFFLRFSTLEGDSVVQVYCKLFVDSAHVLHFQNRSNMFDQKQSISFPDIDASEAFFEILRHSDWSQRQSPETQFPVRDWLVRRLDREIHNLLYQGSLGAWGCRCLDPFKEAPDAQIPSKEWAEIEINFAPYPRTSAIWRVRKSAFNAAYAGIRFSSRQIYALFPLREEIPLFESAVSAFECTRNNDISILAQSLTDSSEEGILCWYCDRLCRYQNGNPPLTKLWGIAPPSRERDEIHIEAHDGYDFVIEGKTINLQQRCGKSRYENLTVRRKELNAAISTLAEIKA